MISVSLGTDEADRLSDIGRQRRRATFFALVTALGLGACGAIPEGPQRASPVSAEQALEKTTGIGLRSVKPPTDAVNLPNLQTSLVDANASGRIAAFVFDSPAALSQFLGSAHANPAGGHLDVRANVAVISSGDAALEAQVRRGLASMAVHR